MSNKLLVQQKTKTKKKNNKRRGSRKGETLNTQLHTSSCKMNETSILPHNRNSNSKKHNKILWLTDLYLEGTRISTMSPFQIFPNLVKKKRSKRNVKKKVWAGGEKKIRTEILATTLLPVNRLTMTDCNTAVLAKIIFSV